MDKGGFTPMAITVIVAFGVATAGIYLLERFFPPRAFEQSLPPEAYVGPPPGGWQLEPLAITVVLVLIVAWFISLPKQRENDE